MVAQIRAEERDKCNQSLSSMTCHQQSRLLWYLFHRHRPLLLKIYEPNHEICLNGVNSKKVCISDGDLETGRLQSSKRCRELPDASAGGPTRLPPGMRTTHLPVYEFRIRPNRTQPEKDVWSV